MLVDVTFDGVSLARGANARPDGPGNGGWFVELEQPMPVGTLLELSGETQAAVRVARVTEGVGAGMLLLPVGAADKNADARPEAKSDGKADAKPDAKKGDKPEAAKSEAKGGDGDGDDEPESGAAKSGNGAGKDRRKKPRKPSGA